MLLILYYAVMIFLDIQKAKAAKAAEHEKNNEEDIDISDEASTFKPVMITRDEAPKNNSESDSAENDKENKTDNERKSDKSDKSEPEKSKPDITQSDKPKSDKPKSEPPVQEKKPETEKTDRPTPEVPHEEKPEPTKDSTSENTTQDSPEDDSTESSQSSDKPFRRPGYREAIMTGYISVDSLIDEANQLAETGEWDLGNVIHTCDNAA